MASDKGQRTPAEPTAFLLIHFAVRVRPGTGSPYAHATNDGEEKVIRWEVSIRMERYA